PAVLSVTLKLPVPPAKAALAGKVALASLEVIPTVSETPLTKLKFASTAFTVTLNAAPAVWAVGVPLLPVGVPGAAVSPGARICSLVKAPGFTATAELVLDGIVGCVTSDAVTVALPAVFSVTESVFVPLTNAALAGSAAFKSVEASATVSLVL